MLADIASIATLILFVIYFIGRTFVIVTERRMCYDEISLISKEENCKFNIIDEIDTLQLDGVNTDYSTTMVLTSNQGIHDIKVFKIAYDENMNVIKNGFQEIGECDFLNVGQSFALEIVLPELFPKYRITYHSHDYKRIVFDVCANLKNGVISEMAKPKHTLKSILFYLFR